MVGDVGTVPLHRGKPREDVRKTLHHGGEVKRQQRGNEGGPRHADDLPWHAIPRYRFLPAAAGGKFQHSGRHSFVQAMTSAQFGFLAHASL